MQRAGAFIVPARFRNRRGQSSPNHGALPRMLSMAVQADECWAILLAAGRGERMAEACAARGALPNSSLCGRARPLWWHSVLALAAVPPMRGIVLVFPPDLLETARQEAEKLVARRHPGVPVLFQAGRIAPSGFRAQRSEAPAVLLRNCACSRCRAPLSFSCARHANHSSVAGTQRY